jgi:hypothetical protein
MKRIVSTTIALLTLFFVILFTNSLSASANHNFSKMTAKLPEKPYPGPGVNATSLALESSDASAQSPYPPPENSTSVPILIGTPLSPIDYPYHIYLPIILKPSYNRLAAVDHADAHAHDRSTEYPEFGTGCVCDDCTNYISQSLHKGGLALKTGNWDPLSVFEWWYRPIYVGQLFIKWENSNSWSATPDFNTYLFQYLQEFEYMSWPTELEAGDFILMDLHGASLSEPPDGIPDHARFIVGYGFSSTEPADYGCIDPPIQPPPATYGLLANQHCVDRKHVLWDFRIEDIPVWPWHVK